MYFDLDFGGLRDVSSGRHKLELAARLGFDCVVSENRVVTGVTPGEKPNGTGFVELEEVLTSNSLARHNSRKLQRPLTVSRITVVTDSTAATCTLTSNGPARQNFSIVAVQPLSRLVFTQACRVLDVDLIYLDLSTALKFKMVLADLQDMIKRGVHLELDYRPAVQNSAPLLTRFFAAAQMVCKATRGKNIVLSSRAQDAFQLRGPQDIVNFATLMGMSMADAQAAVSGRCEAVLRHALAAKGAPSITVAKRPKELRPKRGEPARNRVAGPAGGLQQSGRVRKRKNPAFNNKWQRSAGGAGAGEGPAVKTGDPSEIPLPLDIDSSPPRVVDLTDEAPIDLSP